MTRKELLATLKRHDWYYMYSDDGGVYACGSAAASSLREELQKHNCPFEWWDIHKAIIGDILENHKEMPDGLYRKPEWKYECIASRRREDLITQEQADEILAWFNE